MLTAGMRNHWSKKLSCLFIVAVSLCLSACNEATSEPRSEVRLAVVNTPNDSGLLPYLLKDFEAQTGIHVTIRSSDDPFSLAREGKADMLIAHYGKSGMAELVTEGYGSWPRMVFSNQAVLIGPKNDPAGVSQTTSLVEAFKAIHSTGHTLIANDNAGIHELTRIAATAAGLTTNGEWYQEAGVSKGKAIKAAEKAGAYVIWGAVPFLKFKANHGSTMDVLLSHDPTLQRVMALSVISKAIYPDVNQVGAEAVAAYLLSADTQAKVMQFRVTGSDHQLWWPAARHN